MQYNIIQQKIIAITTATNNKQTRNIKIRTTQQTNKTFPFLIRPTSILLKNKNRSFKKNTATVILNFLNNKQSTNVNDTLFFNYILLMNCYHFFDHHPPSQRLPQKETRCHYQNRIIMSSTTHIS